jgi:hypothetical protein
MLKLLNDAVQVCHGGIVASSEVPACAGRNLLTASTPPWLAWMGMSGVASTAAGPLFALTQ